MRTVLTPVHRRAVAAMVAVLASCGLTVCGASADGQSAGERPTVVVTTSILGDIVASTVGEAVDVEVLIPRGADPHSFEASARQAVTVRDADLVVANGLGLETSLDAVLGRATDGGTPVLELAPLLDPIPLSGGGHDEERDEAGDEGHGHDALDPHVWLDPVRMAGAVDIVADAVAGLPGVDAGAIRRQAAAYEAELASLHADIERILAAVPPANRRLVANHDNLRYFADRYGFEIVGVVIPGGATLAEASAGDLADLVQVIQAAGVRAVVAENVASDRLVSALASELGGGVQVVTFFTDALGDEGSGGATYPEMLRSNAERLAAALAA